jgi:hypothetical protein
MDGEVQHLTRIKKLPMDDFSSYNRALFEASLDVNKCFDGVPFKRIEEIFNNTFSSEELRRISEKYGVKKENLVVLIKINAEFPSATIFEFSGKKDSNGELVMTYDELVNVYEINEEKNTIIRVSKNGLNNDGVNLIEAKIYMTLVQEYLLPELPNLRENKRYPE